MTDEQINNLAREIATDLFTHVMYGKDVTADRLVQMSEPCGPGMEGSTNLGGWSQVYVEFRIKEAIHKAVKAGAPR